MKIRASDGECWRLSYDNITEDDVKSQKASKRAEKQTLGKMNLVR